MLYFLIAAMSLKSLPYISPTDVNNCWVRSAMPDYVHAVHIFKVFVAEIYCVQFAPDSTLTLNPLKV